MHVELAVDRKTLDERRVHDALHSVCDKSSDVGEELCEDH